VKTEGADHVRVFLVDLNHQPNFLLFRGPDEGRGGGVFLVWAPGENDESLRGLTNTSTS
jgi:hypothetical protein